MMRYVNRVLGWFRTGARTVGLSPKALAPIIGAVIVAAVKAIGLDSDEIAGIIGVVAATVAAWLLPPGDVVVPVGEIPASDDLLAPAVREKLGA